MLETARQSGEPWDVAIIGGGATGLASALDAALRGHRTILIEQADFAKGTSSRSTKLIHGGVRYLRQGDMKLVHEALRERTRLLKNAPHVVRPLPFVIPGHSWREQAWYGIGLKIYDLLSGRRGLRRSCWLSRSQVQERLPGLKMRGIRGGTMFYDAQFDDTRLAISMARTAADFGACLLSYVAARGLEKDAEGKIVAIRAEDAISGEQLLIRAKTILNATGVFTDGVRRLDEPDAKPVVLSAQGVHIVLDSRFLKSEGSALLIPETADGRVLFAIPWHNRVVIGTTDTARSEAELEPRPLAEEIDYLLGYAARYLKKKPTRADVLSAWAGLRPLVKPPKGEAGESSAISRDHSLFVSKSGLITIAGGKWTTCRHMAEDAIDKVEEIGGLEPLPCRTATQKLQPDAPKIGKFEPLHPNLPYDEGDVRRAVSVEMAMTLEDVLARRTRALFLDVVATLQIAPRVARIMADEAGRDAEWQNQQLLEFSELANRYLVS